MGQPIPNKNSKYFPVIRSGFFPIRASVFEFILRQFNPGSKKMVLIPLMSRVVLYDSLIFVKIYLNMVSFIVFRWVLSRCIEVSTSIRWAFWSSTIFFGYFHWIALSAIELMRFSISLQVWSTFSLRFRFLGAFWNK